MWMSFLEFFGKGDEVLGLEIVILFIVLFDLI